MKFSDISGHAEAKEALRNLIDSGKIPHAFLFSGAPGIGKFRLARALSQYIHCKNHVNGDSCGVCPSCVQHQKLNNPDLHFVYPIPKKDGMLISKDAIEQWKTNLETNPYMSPAIWNEIINAGNSQPAIFVNESEAIISRASLSAYQENFKIFLIWQPEKMRPEAANKLLKIIEEPFEDTIFILVSNDDSRLLPTLLSRTRRFNLSPLSEQEIVSALVTQEEIEAELAEEVAHIAEGSMEKALEIACRPDELREFSSTFQESMRMAYVLKAKRLKEIADDLAAMGREKLIRYLAYCGRMIREYFICNFKMPELNGLTSDEKAFGIKFAPFIHEGNVEQLNEIFAEAATDIERNANAKIVMFDLMLSLSRFVRMPKPNPLPLSFSNQ